MPKKKKIPKKTQKAANLINSLLSTSEQNSLRLYSGKNTIWFKDRLLRKYGHLFPIENHRKTKAIAIEIIKKYQFSFGDSKLSKEREQFIDELGNKLFANKKCVIIKKLTRIVTIIFKIILAVPTAVAFISRITSNK